MLNESNITIDVANVLIHSQTEVSDYYTLFSQFLIPIISICVTGYIAYYTITNNMRSTYIQANQAKISQAMVDLSELIERGRPKEIKDFLNSSQGIYIPKPMRKKIRKKCAAEKINKKQLNKMLDEINNIISP